ncbi:hypothetical protein [Streptosporangium lutulentum]|uniref:Uncharacterized protein n=1 Tax=Streptosporangium lutulentum TaxID=1461250 RepID=A0ABT9Q8W4_9ACTN|nr:hypothetical protein [Streptosporangium lutulentum]MDP9843191.1 hypothetical protein [Streptosporangium lutulentum]
MDGGWGSVRKTSRGQWQRWPAGQAATVWEFLHAWWAHTLTDPDPAVAAYEVLTLVTEASGTAPDSYL